MMKPFADDKASSSIGELTAENGTVAVVIAGICEVTRDKAGLKRARELKRLADALVSELEAADDLPERVEAAGQAGDEVANPFA